MPYPSYPSCLLCWTPVDRWPTGCSNGRAFITPLPALPHGWGRVRVGGICIDMV
jgi:hypothetical protein